MRCKACDQLLSEREDAATFEQSGTRVELCSACASWLPHGLGVLGLDVYSQLADEAPLGREMAPWEEEE